MVSTLPTPLAAAIGLVPTVLDGVRRLPGKAVQLPVLAVSGALSTMDGLRTSYDDLAQRGERLLASLRGEAVDVAAEAVEDLQDVVADLPPAAPFATARDTAAELLDDAADALDDGPAPEAPTAAAEAATPSTPATPAAEAPKSAPTPKAVEPDTTRVDTAATASVVEVVEQAVAEVGGAPLEHDELPLPDYDHMTLGSLRGRLRALSIDQLVQIRTYEKAHADRLPIVTMLDNRIAKLSTDASAAPSGPVSTRPAAGQVPSGPASTISPATTTAPPVNPPSQGDPTNPAQPR